MRSHLVSMLLLAAQVAAPIAVWTAPACAQDQDETTGDQINLVWVAGYQGPLSGRMGPKAREAVSRFQASLGTARTGYLTEYERDELERQAVAEKHRLGWQMRLDEPTGLRIGVPETFLGGITRKDSGTEYRGVRNAFLLRTMVKPRTEAVGLREHMDFALNAVREQGFVTTYMTFKDDWFVINASSAASPTDVYVRMHAVGPWIKGYMLFTPRSGGQVGALVPAVSLSLEADAAEPRYRPPAPPPVAEPSPPSPPPAVATVVVKPAPPPEPPGKSGTGSGFVVAPGKVLTNHHVVDGCGSVSIAGGEVGATVATDAKNDLALVSFPYLAGQPLVFAPEPARLGEDVVAMGYPLGQILGNRLNITQGIVSSTEGFRGDWTTVQITVPIQKGNSGGPLLDLEGRVRGMVSSKLVPVQLASGEMLTPEQIAFAIKGEVVRGFLKGNGITPIETASAGKEGRKSTADIAETAKGSVVQLVCR